MLKVAVPIPGDGTRGAEHLWVTPFKRLSATEFVAIVQNDPAYIPALKVGDTLSFSDQQISDWAFYGDEGELFGGYTMRVTIAEFPDSANGTDMAEPPVPADW
jgi:uncharacterized protein YegJ (DUF2314 family)